MDASTLDLQRDLPQLLPRLWRFAMRLTRERSDAEDLVQRCCLRALERRDQWRPDTSLLSWLFSIMHSIWLNEIRTRQHRRKWTAELDEDQLDLCHDRRATDPSEHALYRQVIAAVEALPEEQRSVVLLVAVEGLSYKEAAVALSVPIGTVMSRLARARIAIGGRFSSRPGGRGGKGRARDAEAPNSQAEGRGPFMLAVVTA